MVRSNNVEISFQPCDLAELESFPEYLASLSSPVDGFLTDHLIKSQWHRILIDGQAAGSFAIHEGESLWHFYIVKPVRRYGQRRPEVGIEQRQPNAILLIDQ